MQKISRNLKEAVIYSKYVTGQKVNIQKSIVFVWSSNQHLKQFSKSVLSDSLWPHGLQHTPVHHKLPDPVQTHVHQVGDATHPTISSSVIPFSSCFQSFPSSGSFPISQFFASGGQSTGISFSFSISPSNKYSGLISFRIDWLDLLAVHRTLKSLLQHHSSKASILWYSAFFIVQLSHPYMTTRKTIALTRWTFVGKVMSLPLIRYLG